MSIERVSDLPVKVDGSQLQPNGEAAVVSLPGDAVVVELNRTAAALWELCDGHTSTDEMVVAVCALFGLNVQQARVDVSNALDQMRQAGVLR